MKHKKGFTLAETLLTLVVMGVLISVSMPIIRKAFVDADKMKFEKAYKAMEQIVYNMVRDEDAYPFDSTNYGFKNTVTVKLGGQTYGGVSKFRDLFKTKVKILKEDPSDDWAFTTEDNIYWIIEDSDFSKNDYNERVLIRIDVDGNHGNNCYDGEVMCKKRKNTDACKDETFKKKGTLTACCEQQTTCSNPDQFKFYVDYMGRSYVDGKKEREYLHLDEVMHVNKLRRSVNDPYYNN